jgi:hypothetical protein
VAEWQTRTVQVRVSVRTWGFNSPLAHKIRCRTPAAAATEPAKPQPVACSAVVTGPRARAALGKVKRRLQPTPQRGTGRRTGEKATQQSQYTAQPGDRLLEKPVFILCSIRSGSTLLRVMLNSHSQIHAPHETHLAGLHLNFGGRFARDAMHEIELDEVQLQYLLWDRILHRELTRHGKSVIVNKTPSDAFRWQRIIECWPDARFIYLLRHPAAIAGSWGRAKPEMPLDRVVGTVLPYMRAVEDARTHQDGLTVRYEDLTNHPERELRRICEFIGVDYEPGMVDYGQGDHGSFKAGLGDWSDRIRSGKVQPVEQLPSREEIPPRLLDISAKWGYLSP